MKCLASLLLVGALATAARAGLYTPEEPFPFRMRPDGLPEAIEHQPTFLLEFDKRYNAANPTVPLVDPGTQKETQRGLLMRRIAELQPRARSLPPAELAGLAANLLRIGKASDALNLLAPHARGRAPDFRVVANFVHILATNGEWDAALRAAELLMDIDFPTDLAGTTPEQRKWLLKVERQYYLRWIRLHRERVNQKLAPEAEDVLPLFPVKFVNDAGRYEPGKLAAAEKEKLPSDAIPIVQQLILWAPWDISLQWLLGELYAANGQLRDSEQVFRRCADAGQYSNRKVFMDHRTLVLDAAAKSTEKSAADIVLPDAPPSEESTKPNDDFLPSRERVIVFAAVFGVVALGLIALQVRSIGRRLRGGSGSRG